MSDTPPPATPAADAPQPTPAATVKPKNKRRTWRQRVRLTLLVLLILAFCVRIALNFLLPTVINKIAAIYDLEVGYDRLSLGILGGDAQIWGLKVRPAGGGDPILQSEYLHGDIQPLELFRGRLVAYRAEVDGLIVSVDREADGSIPLLNRFVAQQQKQAAPPPAAPGSPQPIKLESPLTVEAVRLTHVTVRLQDKSVTPTFYGLVRTNVRVSDIGRAGEPVRFELDVGIDGPNYSAVALMDELRVAGEAFTSPTELNLKARTTVRGVHPRAALGYLNLLNLAPAAAAVSADGAVDLTVKTIPNSSDFSADLAVSGVKALADGQEWASLKSLKLQVKRLGPAAAEVDSIAVDGGRLAVHRNAAGNLEAAGLAVVPAATPPATQPASPNSPQPVAAQPVTPPFRLTLGTLSVTDCVATFTDDAVTPPGMWTAKFDSLSLKGIDTDSSKSLSAIPFSIAASLPGLAERIKVDGTAVPFADEKSVQLNVAADAIRPDLLRPYLAAFGVESRLKNGSFAAEVSAKAKLTADDITASATAKNVKFADGGNALIELGSATLDGLSYSLKTGAIGAKLIDLNGPGLRVIRDTDGQPMALGFKYTGPPATPVAAQPAAAAVAQPSAQQAPAQPSPIVLPRISVDLFNWRGARLILEDRDPASPGTFTVESAGASLEHFLLDLAATETNSGGRFVAWLSSPGLADALVASGAFSPGPNRLTVTAEVNGQGLNGTKLTPYLKPFGVVPTLTAGRVVAKASGTIWQTDPRLPLGVSLEAHDVSYTDGDTELAGVDFANINGLSVTGKRIDADAINVLRPRAKAAREADGTLAAGGIRLVPVQTAPATQPVVTTPVTPAATQPAALPSLKLAALPIEFGVKSLHVADASLEWADAAVSPPAKIKAVAERLILSSFDTASDAPAVIDVRASVDGVVGSVSVKGRIVPKPDAPSAVLSISASRLRVGPLASYLPIPIETVGQDDRLDVGVRAGLRNADGGGLSGEFGILGLDYSDHAQQPAKTLAHVDQFSFFVERFDPAAEVYTIGELSSSGVEGYAKQSATGLEAVGVRFPAVKPAATQPAATQPAKATEPSPAAPVASLATMVGDARKPLPTLKIAKLDLGLKKFTASGFTGENAADVLLQDVRLSSPDAITLGGRRAEELPPVKLNLTGGVEPLVSQFKFGLELTPFASEPRLTVDVNANGIRGDGITKVLPALAGRLDGSGLKDGTFVTKFDGSINYGRKGPRDFGIDRGFTAMFDVQPLEFRAEANGPVLAGVGQVHGEAIKVEPRNGNVTVKAIEIGTPLFRAYRDDRGLNALGLTLLLGRDESAETLTAPASQPAETPAPPPGKPSDNSRPANEMRLDRFTVTGADILIEDRTGKPFTVVPVKGLDVDVQGLSNQLPWNGKAVRFSVLSTSDKVALPPRKGAKGEATTNTAEGSEYTEQRELFSQVTASGKVGFARNGDSLALDGWVKTAVNGFELLGIRGLAQQYGVTIGGGVFDDTNDVRFNPTGMIETKNKIVFTNLSLSEPADGPIRRILKLPAPIDVAIAAVTDTDGSITMNVPVPIKNGAINPGDVAGPAIGAVANVLITGIASAPLKAVGGVGDLLGFGGKDAKPEPPVVVTFLPGYAGLNADAANELAKLADELKKDDTLELQIKQTLTEADVARAAVRANPSPETALALATQLRSQRAGLVEKYAELSAQARGAFGAQDNTTAKQTAAELADTGRRIAQADASLDNLYTLTTPGAAAQAERRTKNAALQTARERVDAVKAALVAGNVPSAETRVHTTNPQYTPVAGDTGGSVTVLLVRKKK